MNKYIIHRLDGETDGDSEPIITGSVVVGVEYGTDIFAATDAIIKTVNEDALGLDKYMTGFTASAFEPEEESGGVFTHTMMIALEPEYGEQNDLMYYGIIEKDETER